MDIHSLRLDAGSAGQARLSAVVGSREVWFDVTGAPFGLRASYDPFVVGGFALAMESGEELRVAGDAPVSPGLVENLASAMDICAAWWPEHLTRVQIRAERTEDGDPAPAGSVGCFFSGGADSLYSFIVNQEAVTHLVLCRGLDIPPDEEERWRQTEASVRAVAEAHHKRLILVDTNAKKALQAPVAADNHGAVLVSTALGLGLETLLVPASHAWDYFQRWGSHPLLDPLFGNGTTRVVHDHPAPRSTKMEAIVRTGIGLDSLRVCNVQTLFNCGRCEKCLRTRVMLTLLGARAEGLESLRDAAELRQVRVYDDSQVSYWEENAAYARAMGRDDIARECARIVRSYRVRVALRTLDREVGGGMLGRLKRTLARN